MSREIRAVKCGLIALLLVFPLSSIAATVSGVLEIKWGDPIYSSQSRSQLSLSLGTIDDTSFPLNVPSDLLRGSGGAQGLFNRRVTVTTREDLPLREPGDTTNPPVLNVLSITPESAVGAQRISNSAISQTHRFVSILCKYAGNMSEQEPFSFFENMYGNLAGELNHYWKEVSSDNINIDGSTAHGWYSLPQNRDYYLQQPNTLTALFNDCVGVADDDIDFTSVDGVNLMFNDQIDGFAWGGSRYTTLDGITKSWPTTWEPPWGWGNVTVMAHEMGHSFGLPHSNNSDLDSSPYDNPWTVMSDAWSFGVMDPVYGTRGKHLNAYEKERLGWLSGSEIYVHDNQSRQSISIEPLSYNVAGPNTYRAAKIPVDAPDIDFYTVEVRTNGTSGGEYDANLPGTAVVIHSVKHSRSEPAWIIDADNPPATSSHTEGVMWRVGEVFLDEEYGVRVSVDSPSANGFEITIGEGGSSPIPIVIGSIDNAHYGYNHGSNLHKNGVSFLFDGNDNDLILSTSAFDIDFNGEVKIQINEEQVGLLSSGPDNAHTEQQLFAVEKSLLKPSGNILTFEQQTSGFTWGVSGVLLSIDANDVIPLIIGTIDSSHYGYQHGDGLRKSNVTFSFDGNENDLTLTAAAFDIDFYREVKILVNGVEVGYFASGLDNQHTAVQAFAVEKSLLQVSNNQLTFEQRNNGFKWGVSDILLSVNTNDTIPLVIGVADNNHYGNGHGTNQHRDHVSYVFDGDSDGLILSVTGYDIDFNREVKIIVNDTPIGYLSSGNNNQHTVEQSFAISRSLLLSSGNVLKFEQRTSGFKWGVSGVLLSGEQ